MNNRLVQIVALGVLSVFSSTSVYAVPSFARKYEKACSSCHTAWPLLNKAGRIFKESGYRFPNDKPDKTQTISDFSWEKRMPFSAILVARPYDKKDSGSAKIRALHEVELIAAGRISDRVSGYFELEMEDEPLDIAVTGGGGGTVSIPGFQWLIMPHGSATYHVSRASNISFTWGPASWTDPYDSYAQNRRLFRGSSSAIPAAIQDSRQQVSLYGRINDLFYSLGVAGVAGDTEGSLGAGTNTIARIAYDISKTTIGAMHVGDASTRTGLDVQSKIGSLRLNGIYITGGTSDDYSLQVVFINKGEGGKPGWVPAVRFESVSGANRTAANLGYYFKSNTKGYLEYYTEPGDSRLTLQFITAF